VPIPPRLTSALACLLAPIWVATGAGALDLNGTWEGKWTCDGFNGSKVKPSLTGSVLLVNGFNVDRDGGTLYQEVIIPDVNDPDRKGEALMVLCTTEPNPTNSLPGEMIRFKAKVDPVKGTGTLRGTSTYDDGMSTVFTCKYTYKRVDPTPPGVSLCVDICSP
jgi:hypothetical protein